MKKAILFLGMVCMATTAMAFGGGGSGHDSTKYNRHNPGVDNFGVHIHPDDPPLDIRFYDIKDDANAQPCQEGANVYCCKAGYVVDVATSKCVACPAGSVATLEENFKCTVCTEEEGISLDKTACCDPADEDCMNPNKECHPDYLGNCGQNDCSDMGGKWCGNKNQCVSKNEECCPNGGSLGEDGQTCCLGGYAYNGSDCVSKPAEGYCGVNIPVCGCEESYSVLSATGKGCCAKGDHKYYDDGTHINGWNFGMNNVTECKGCGYGKWVEKDGKQYCCDDLYDISYCSDNGANGLPNCYTPASTGADITQVCCEESGMKWCSGNNTCIDKQASCPCAGEQPACQKCEDGEWVADTEKNGKACWEVGLCYNGDCFGESCQYKIGEVSISTDGKTIAPHCCEAEGGKYLYGDTMTHNGYTPVSRGLCCYDEDGLSFNDDGTPSTPPLSDCLFHTTKEVALERLRAWIYTNEAIFGKREWAQLYLDLTNDSTLKIVEADLGNGDNGKGYCICNPGYGAIGDRPANFCREACATVQ